MTFKYIMYHWEVERKVFIMYYNEELIAATNIEDLKKSHIFWGNYKMAHDLGNDA